MVTPALVSMIFTLASPPPGLQMELSGFTVNVQKSDAWWIVMQIANAVFFPIAAIGRSEYEVISRIYTGIFTCLVFRWSLIDI